MAQNPLVTLICICYNHEPFVLESLDSVISQSYKNIQIIIVDDASTDNSVKEIEKWLVNKSNITFIKNKINVGNTISFNKALKLVEGDFIIDLATDDVLLHNTIATQIDAFKTNEQKALVFGNAELINEQGNFLSYYFDVDTQKCVKDKSLHTINYIHILKGGNCMCSVSAMIRTTILKELGGFDENLFYEDLDVWLRITRKYPIHFIDTPLIKKRLVSQSQSSFFYQNNAYSKKINTSTFIVLEKAFKMNSNKQENKALLKRIHHEIVHNFELKNYNLLMKNLILKLKVHLKNLFYFI